jgi:hypothetical protein
MVMADSDFHEAERLLRESDALFRALGDVRMSALTQARLAATLVARDRYADADRKSVV